MKKLVGIGLAAAISFGALSGCSLLGEKANGLVLYGSEEQVQKITDQNKKEVKEKDFYKMKSEVEVKTKNTFASLNFKNNTFVFTII